MKLKFISDLHLGKLPQSHSTPSSRKRFQAALHGAAMKAVRDSGCLVVCLGDLFDRPSNPEAVIKQGADVAAHCDYVLAGNHDLHGREGVMSSLQLLANMDDEKPWKYMFDTLWCCLNDTAVCLIPHQPSQADFEKELDLAQEAAPQYKHGTKILCLHANYDSPFTGETESALNLTRGRAERLLEVFDHIVMGHEHASRTDFGGRLVMVGSLLPTDFGNINDKWVWSFNTVHKTMTAEMFWDKADDSRRMDWKGAGELALEGVQFVDVVGTATPSEMSSVAKTIQDIWQRGESLLLVRNSVTVTGSEEIQPSGCHRHLDVVDRIRQELAGSELGGLFEQYLERQQ